MIYPTSSCSADKEARLYTEHGETWYLARRCRRSRACPSSCRLGVIRSTRQYTRGRQHSITTLQGAAGRPTQILSAALHPAYLVLSQRCTGKF